MRGTNDIGGLPAGEISTTGHEPEYWQKALNAVVSALSPAGRNIIRIDEFRRSREALPAEVYRRLSYFELWTAGLANLLIEKGLITHDQIAARMEEIKKRG